ncbi:MAG: hypothetical protein ACRELZ_21180 [Candidatus Rokuibacteriota bacterium]
MFRAVEAATPKQPLLGRIDDGVHRKTGDVTEDDLNARIIPMLATHP